MASPEYSRVFVAEGTIPAYSIVKMGAADFGALQATAVTESFLGVTGEIAAASGERVDVVVDGPAFVLAGGTITRGDYLTSDSSGRAITAAPSAGVNNEIIGKAYQSAVVGDVFEASIEIGKIQG